MYKCKEVIDLFTKMDARGEVIALYRQTKLMAGSTYPEDQPDLYVYRASRKRGLALVLELGDPVGRGRDVGR